ncbi:MAG: hypothetical protein IIV16_02820 [Alistipes sp.]|nr:hypothetical protein [Alistipes sp.]
MKNLKMIYSMLVVVVTSLFMACTADSTYTPGEVPAGPQVSFSNDVNDNPEFLEVAGVTDNVKKVVLNRIVTDEALDVYIIADAGDNAALFTLPEKVTFAAGESKAYYEITVNDYSKLEENKTYEVSLLLADEKQGTPYGDAAFTAKIKLFPWTLIKTEDDVEEGKFRGGDVFSALFDDVAIDAEIGVKVYEHNTNKGVYMVQNPWLKLAVPALGLESEEAAVISGGFKHTVTNLVINCINPAKCYIEKQNMGLSYGSAGDLMIASDYHPEANPTGLAGTFEDGVIVFPAEAILAGASKYEGGEMFASNFEGMFRVVFPGKVAMDYNVAVDYLGMEVSPDMQNVIAKFTVNYGGDVTGLKYYFAEGNVVANPQRAIDALINGTATDIREVEGFTKGGKTMQFNTTIANGGLYTIVVAAVNGVGELVAKTAAVKSFYYSGLGNTGSHPCDITLEVGDYTAYNTDDENDDTANHNAVGYNIKGKNIKRLYIGAMATSALTAYLAKEGKSYETLIVDEKLVPFTAEEFVALHSEAGKSGALINLDAESEYTVFAIVTNDYEERDVITKTHKTGIAPVYSGEFKVGKYLWKYEKSKTKYETIIEVQSHQGSSTRFVVSNLGYNDGSQWFATYDAEKGTLTLDGKVKGREKEGNLFGKEFGIGKFLDKNGKEVEYKYIYLSTLESGTNSPLVFNVDKDTKAICGQQNKSFSIMLFDVNTSATIGTHCKFDNSTSTTIAPYVEGATE